MRQIDFRLPDAPLFELEYFKYGFVRVLEMGYKPWLEQPSIDADARGMLPIIDARDDGQRRGVHGYFAWGIIGTTFDGAPGQKLADYTDKAMWSPAQFINMKDNFFHVPLDESPSRYNAVRIWARWDVRIFARFVLGKTDTGFGQIKMVNPVTGQQLFNSNPSP